MTETPAHNSAEPYLAASVVQTGCVAEFQAALALAERIDREAQSIDTTTLLAHLAVIAQDDFGYSHCPRCERQRYDERACGLCGDTGWLDETGEAFTYA